MIRTCFQLFVALAITVQFSCKEERKEPPIVKTEPGKDDNSNDFSKANETIVKLGWVDVKNTFGDLPSHVKVFKSPSSLVGKSAIAYIAVADMKKAKWDVLGDVAYREDKNGYGATSLNTLTQFYSKNNLPIIINAGLFYYANSFYYSQNLVVRNGTLLSPNVNYSSKDWETIWYPTIGAFVQLKNDSFKSVWTYFTNNGVNYSYDVPASNSFDKSPLKIPDATFPGIGTTLDAKTAIGGAGVLLKNGDIKNTHVEEMLDISATSNQPRTAIGITADKRMVLFVCEGRNMTSGVAGLTTLDVATILKDLGCVEALNLDGGGSTCMLVNGKETIKPSNTNGSQRAVLTAISLQ